MELAKIKGIRLALGVTAPTPNEVPRPPTLEKAETEGFYSLLVGCTDLLPVGALPFQRQSPAVAVKNWPYI